MNMPLDYLKAQSYGGLMVARLRICHHKAWNVGLKSVFSCASGPPKWPEALHMGQQLPDTPRSMWVGSGGREGGGISLSQQPQCNLRVLSPFPCPQTTHSDLCQLNTGWTSISSGDSFPDTPTPMDTKTRSEPFVWQQMATALSAMYGEAWGCCSVLPACFQNCS